MQKLLIGVLIVSVIGMFLGLGGIAISSYAIKKGCTEKIADGSLTEEEKRICRRHGYL